MGPRFEGDDDDAVALKQHDVYRDALHVLVLGCIRHVEFSLTVLGDGEDLNASKLGLPDGDLSFTFHPDPGAVRSIGTVRYDHRTLQNGHDLLAAAWRFRVRPPQSELFEPPCPPEKVQELWLGWLYREVESWTDHPSLVRSLYLVLTNQNEPPGYIAESQLCLGILARFSEVPWLPELYDRHRRAAFGTIEKEAGG